MNEKKWNFISEARISLRTKTIIPSPTNVFGEESSKPLQL